MLAKLKHVFSHVPVEELDYSLRGLVYEIKYLEHFRNGFNIIFKCRVNTENLFWVLKQVRVAKHVTSQTGENGS